LKLLGLPVINAEGEAEALCARLAKHHFVDYIFTEDSDAITYAISMDGPNDCVKVIRRGKFNTFEEFCTKTLL
jgi:5'-3' exonuclease